MNEEITLETLEATNGQILYHEILLLKNLIDPIEKGYKERIYEGQASLIFNLFFTIYKRINLALLTSKKSAGHITQEEMENLRLIIQEISDLVKRVRDFVLKLPEVNHFQKHLSKFQIYKSDFTRFNKALSKLNIKLNSSLTKFGLIAASPMEDGKNGYNIKLAIEQDSLLIKKELFAKLKNTPSQIQKMPLLIKQLNGEFPLFYLFCLSKKGKPQLIELNDEIIQLKQIDFQNTLNIFVSDNKNIEIYDEIKFALKKSLKKSLRKTFKEDEEKLCDVFKDTNYKEYVARPSANREEDKRDANKYEKIVEGQIISLKNYMNPIKQKSRLDRIDASLIFPLCEVTFFEKLASGTSGAVYRGLFRKQEVIIKTLEGITEEDVEGVFFNEIQTMSRVRSKYITQLYGVCWVKDFKCLIIEYMTKGSLYHCLDQMTFTEVQQKKIALDIAYGLYNLSCFGGMSHGNLNSYNVMIDENFGAKLTDFSCAKTRHIALTTVQLTRSPIQSYEWMAPELLLVGDVLRTQASDIFSFGMILWEIFTGNHPFANRVKDSNSYREFVNELYDGEGLRESLDGIPEPIAKLIENCWRKNSEERPTIDEIIESLENYVPVPQPKNKAIISLVATAEKGDPFAQHRLALCYFNGVNGVNQDYRTAYDLFLKASKQGNGISKIFLANIHARGIGGIPVNIEIAKKYYNQLLMDQRVMEKCPTAMSELYFLLRPRQQLSLASNPHRLYHPVPRIQVGEQEKSVKKIGNILSNDVTNKNDERRQIEAAKKNSLTELNVLDAAQRVVVEGTNQSLFNVGIQKSLEEVSETTSLKPNQKINPPSGY